MAGERILVVDDEPHILNILRFQLEMAGYGVRTARNGLEALSRVEEEKPDLVLLDLMMPQMDGYEVCRRMKSNYDSSHIPVIMVTAKGDLEEKLRGLEDGANDYLTKPFAIAELLIRVRNVLQYSQSQRQANPLTGLPGNVTIQEEMDVRLRSGEPFAFSYADLDNFKAFNDYYGYARGDEAIKLTARVIADCVREDGNQDDFVGHIGGDDFVLMTTPDRVDKVTKRIVKEFDGKSRELCDPGDLEKGYLEVKNRQGQIVRSPLLSITLAVVTNELYPIAHHAKVSDISSELKGYGKRLSGSVVVKERRREPS